LRKFIFIALSVLLVLSFTAFALAEEPQIKLGGRILVRGWYFDNVSSDLPLDAAPKAVYTTNAYLTVDAKIADNLQAFMELETCNNDTGTSGLYIWGTYNQKPNADLQFRQLWLQYTGSGLLGVPSGLKVGHQLVTLGEKQFLNLERFGTDAILVFIEPSKELFLGAVTLKLAENAFDISSPGRQSYTDNTDDLDAYVLLGTYKLDKDNTIGLNYTYANLSDVDLAVSNIGIHANGLLWGALTYGAEFDMQFGEIYDPNEDVGGWAFMAKVGYKLDPVNLRASFAYGSGDDDFTDNDIDEYQVVMDTALVSPLARFVHYTQIYERTIMTAAVDQNLGAGYRSSGIANTTYFNLGLDFSPMKDLSMSLDGFYLLATETGAWEDVIGSTVDDSIGWEIDFKGSYKITKNLTYFVEAAYFNAGDFYKDIMSPVEEESVTQLVHGLNITF
jgi:predicted porin